MIKDKLLNFGTVNVTGTGTGGSSDVIDLGALVDFKGGAVASQKVVSELGFLKIYGTMTGTGHASKVIDIALQDCDTEGGTYKTLVEVPQFQALLSGFGAARKTLFNGTLPTPVRQFIKILVVAHATDISTANLKIEADIGHTDTDN